MSKIIYSDYYMPSNMVPIKEVLANSKAFLAANASSDLEHAMDKYIKHTDLTEIAIEKDYDLIDIFSSLLTKMFETTNISPNKIKNIFYTNYETYDYTDSVSVPYYLQIKFNLTNAIVLTLHQHCSSTLQAIRMADSLNKTEKGTYSLIFSSSFLKEYYERYINYTIMGDGASITLIGDDDNEGLKIIDTYTVSNGYMSYYCHKHFQNKRLDVYDDLKIKLVTFNCIVKSLKQTAAEHGDWFIDAKSVIAQNISLHFTREYAKNLNIPLDKFYVNYYGGHISDLDNIRNLKDLLDSTKVKKGEKVILFALGTDFKCNNATSVLCQYD